MLLNTSQVFLISIEVYLRHRLYNLVNNLYWLQAIPKNHSVWRPPSFKIEKKAMYIYMYIYQQKNFKQSQNVLQELQRGEGKEEIQR